MVPDRIVPGGFPDSPAAQQRGALGLGATDSECARKNGRGDTGASQAIATRVAQSPKGGGCMISHGGRITYSITRSFGAQDLGPSAGARVSWGRKDLG